MQPLADRLRLRARQLGLSHAEVARRANLEETRYSHYICDRRVPDPATLKRIARVLHTSPNWLIGFTDDDGDDCYRQGGAAAPGLTLFSRLTEVLNGPEAEELERLLIQLAVLLYGNNTKGPV